MKTFIKISILFFAALSVNIAIANEDITGIWQGKLAVSPDMEMVIQFNIVQDASGSYTVVLNTPEGGIVENVKADSVVFDAGKIKIGVAELSGSYEGIFKEGKIEGEWEQEGTSFPLTLKPYKKPTLTKEDMDMLLGTWQGKPVLPEMPEAAEGGMVVGEIPTYLFRFEMSEQGEFTGTFSLANMGMGMQEPLLDMGISDGIFTFKIGKMQKFKGKLTDEKIVGEINVINNPGGMSPSITLVKGEYKAPVYNLNLPKEVKEQLSGKWNGILKMQAMQTISMAVEFSFETAENGDFLGFVNMPEEGGLVLNSPDVKTIDGKQFETSENGNFSGFGDMPEEGISESHIMDAPMNDGKQIEISGNRKFSGFTSTPEGGGSGMPITDANMSDGKLVLKVKAMSGEFSGKISADKIIGEWKQEMPGGTTPLTLNRGAYVAPVYTLNLPDEVMDQLEGKWKGKFNDLDVIFKFEKGNKGDFKGMANLPMFGPNDMPIKEAGMSEGTLNLKIKVSQLSVEFTGELSGDKLDGNLKMPMGDSIPLAFEKMLVQ